MRGRVQHPQLFARLFRLNHRLDPFARRPQRLRGEGSARHQHGHVPRRRDDPPVLRARPLGKLRGGEVQTLERRRARRVAPCNAVARRGCPVAVVADIRTAVPTARFPRDARDPRRVPRRRRGSWTSARGARPRRRRANGPCPPGARRPRRRRAAPRRRPPPREPPPNRPGCNTPAFEPTTRDRREAAAASARNEPCDDGEDPSVSRQPPPSPEPRIRWPRSRRRRSRDS